VINFKVVDGHQLQEEFNKCDNRLRFIVFALAMYLYYKYKYCITITSVMRTQKEQDSIYGDNPEYKKQKWQSVHQFGRGIDIRDSDMVDAIKNDAYLFLEQVIYNGDKHTALNHNVQGLHFHIQTNSDNITELSKITGRYDI